MINSITEGFLQRILKEFDYKCLSCRKRHRNESSPSPRQSPKRRREHSPDSDAYNSGDDKSK